MNGIEILQGDCRETLKTLPDCSVHCVVTSPPYFGLRDYGCDGQIGLESTPDEFVAQMVQVFREVRRVLRDDGVCWLNLGDSYAGSRPGSLEGSTLQGSQKSQEENRLATTSRRRDRVSIPRSDLKQKDMKPKDLIGIPWMVAFALRADGWWLRQDIIWHKPNPMPESVTDRCTKSHEYIFLLTKSARYYFDAIAIQEPVSGTANSRGNGINPKAKKNSANVKQNESFSGAINGMVSDRNKRSVWKYDDHLALVQWLSENDPDLLECYLSESTNEPSAWTVTTKPYSGAHFATFPPDLIEPCILAGTSEHGCCPQCGAPWKRVLEKERVATRPGNKTKVGRVSDDPGSAYECHSGMIVGNRDPQRHCTSTKTIGWSPTCECFHDEDDVHLEPIPCTVLDPFNGSGTTGEVARKCGCTYIGCELNPEYIALTKKRLQQGSLLV